MTDNNRREHNRRHSDRLIRSSADTEDVLNPLKMRLFLGAIFSVFTVIVIFAPLWLYLLVVLWLIIDYFVLLGGTLNWLNQKVDVDFKGTGFFRRILATDARIILATTTISAMVLIADYIYIPIDRTESAFQWSDKPFSHMLHMIYGFIHYTNLAIFDKISPEVNFTISRSYVYIVMIRGLVIGSLIHVIHHLLINQHLAGVQFTQYPPLMKQIHRLVKWVRK